MSGFMNYIRALAKHLVLIIMVLVLVHVGRSFSCIRVDAGFTAMLPDIENGETVLVNRRSARAGKLRRGDIICFSFGSGSQSSTWAGRVAAVAGRTFEVKDATLMVNGRRVGAGHEASLGKFEVPPVLVPRGHVLVTFNKPPKQIKRIEQHLVPIDAIKGRVIR